MRAYRRPIRTARPLTESFRHADRARRPPEHVRCARPLHVTRKRSWPRTPRLHRLRDTLRRFVASAYISSPAPTN